MSAFGRFQSEIYASGLEGLVPELPTDLARLESIAEERLPADVFGYVAGSAGSEATARANRAAFDAWRIVPRLLRDVSAPDIAVTVLGTAMPAPVALAPIGLLGIVHPDGESTVARAAAALGLPMVVSSAATTTLEDLAGAGAGRPAVVPAVLVEGPRRRRELPRACRRRGLPGARRDARHAHHGLAPA